MNKEDIDANFTEIFGYVKYYMYLYHVLENRILYILWRLKEFFSIINTIYH